MSSRSSSKPPIQESIEGKVVVITGASSGLGEAAARRLAAQGASVVLEARRIERLQSLADELNNQGGKALAIKTDVTDPDQVQRLVDEALQAYGRVDVIINNAGLMPHSPYVGLYSLARGSNVDDIGRGLFNAV